METTEPINDLRLANMVAEGHEEGRGGFIVAGDRAREKARRYRLARPQSFVLSLVQAACARAAERVEFAIDREDVRVYFGGRPFTAEELGELQRALFAPQGAELDAGVRALASALAAVMALNPESVRLLSGDDERRVYVELDHADADLIDEVQPGKSGTWLHIHRRYRPGFSLEFAPLIEGHFAEVAVLRARCTWAELPIIVNGERVSRGLEIEGLIGREPLAGDIVHGIIGVVAPAAGAALAPATVDVLSSGVRIARHPLPDSFPAGFRARVDGSRLATDATMRELVRDESYARMIEALAAARDRSLIQLAGLSEHPKCPPWLRALLKQQMMTRWLTCLENQVETQIEGEGAEQPERPTDVPAGDEVLATLADVKLWPASDGGLHSARALLGWEGEVQYARAQDDDRPLPEAVGTVVYAQDDEEAAFLQQALGERAIDVSRAIDRERRYQESFEQWKERRHPPRLGSSYYLVRGTILAPVDEDKAKDEGVRGEVGLRGVGSERCTIRLIKDGCLLQQATLEIPVPGLDAVIEAGFTPNRSYNAAHRNEVLARALFELLKALSELMSALARAWVERRHDISEARALFMPYMFAVLDPDFGINTLRAFGFAPGSAARHMRTLGGDTLTPIWGVWDEEEAEDVESEVEAEAEIETETGPEPEEGEEGEEAEEGAEAEEAEEAEATRAPPEPHPLARVEVFETCAGEGRSLVSIAQMRREHGTIYWLGVEHGPQRGIEEPVLWLTDEQYDALVAIFGEDALTDFSPQLDRLRRRAAFLERPVESLALPDDALVKTAFERGGGSSMRGILAVASDGLRPERLSATRARVRVLKYGRFLGERRVPVLIPGLVGVVNDDEAPVDEAWSGLPEGDEPLALDDAVVGALPALLQSAIDDCYAAQPGEAEHQRLLLLRVPCAVFDQPQMLRVYTALRATSGDDESLEAFAEILDLVALYSQNRVSAALERLLARGETPTAARLKSMLQESAPDASETSEERRARVEVRKRLLKIIPDVELAPLIRTAAGRLLSFAEILGVVREHGSLFYALDEPGAASASGRMQGFDGVERVVTILNSAELHTLRRVLGASALQRAEAWLEARAREGDAAQREAAGLELPVGDRLVAVDIEDRDLSGQIGLRRWGPRADEPAVVRVGTPRGLSLTVFPECELPIIGALQRDDIALDFGIVEMNDAVLERIDTVVADATPALLDELAHRWPELKTFELEAASHWVLHILAARAPSKGVGNITAAEKLAKDKLAAPLLDLQAFSCIDGKRRSLIDLAAALELRGELRYVTEPWAHDVPDFPVVIIDSDRKAELEALFPNLREHAVEWQREQRILKRKQLARRLPALPPREALEATRVDTRGLTGWLWVMPDEGHEAKVRLGHGGLEIERRTLSELYPCEGAIAVSDDEHVSREWDAVEFTRRQLQALESASQQLFRELIETYETVVERGQGAPVSLKGRTRRGLDASFDPAQARVALDGLLIRLHAFRTDGRQRLKSSHRKIYRALADMPLFTLASQRLISLNTALSERPSELSHLGFWKHEVASAGVPMPRNREMSTSHLAEELTEQLPQPTAAQRLLEAVRAELRIVNSNAEDLLTEAYLDLLSIDHLSKQADGKKAAAATSMIGERDGYVVINIDHQVVQRAITSFEQDALLVSVVASAVYSYFTLWAEDLEPGHSRAFITHHAGHVLSGVGA